MVTHLPLPARLRPRRRGAAEAGRAVRLAGAEHRAALERRLPGSFPSTRGRRSWSSTPRPSSPALEWLGQRHRAAARPAPRRRRARGARVELRPARAGPGRTRTALLGRGASAVAARRFATLLGRAGPDWRDRVRVEELRVSSPSRTPSSGRPVPPAARRRALPAAGPLALRRPQHRARLCGLAPESLPLATEAFLAALEPLARDEFKDDLQLADDRSGLYEILVLARRKEGDVARREAARPRVADLPRGRGAQAAPNPRREPRSTPTGSRRRSSWATPALAVPALLQSERDLPTDFNPPRALAIAYRELGRYAEALAQSKRAFDLAQGPRRVRILSDRAAIYEKQGNREARLADPAAGARSRREAARPQQPPAEIAQAAQGARGARGAVVKFAHDPSLLPTRDDRPLDGGGALRPLAGGGARRVRRHGRRGARPQGRPPTSAACAPGPSPAPTRSASRRSRRPSSTTSSPSSPSSRSASAPSARWLHLGMTSSDVLDTALALQLGAAGEAPARGPRRRCGRPCSGARRRAPAHADDRPHRTASTPSRSPSGSSSPIWYAELARARERLARARARRSRSARSPAPSAPSPT